MHFYFVVKACFQFGSNENLITDRVGWFLHFNAKHVEPFLLFALEKARLEVLTYRSMRSHEENVNFDFKHESTF